MHETKMAGKTAKLNCTLTSTTTTKTTDTKRQEDRAKLLSYEHWSTEKVYKKARNFCDLSKQKLVCAPGHFKEQALLRLIAKTN